MKRTIVERSRLVDDYVAFMLDGAGINRASADWDDYERAKRLLWARTNPYNRNELIGGIVRYLDL